MKRNPNIGRSGYRKRLPFSFTYSGELENLVLEAKIF